MKGQKGFSLVQLMIVAGMLSGIFVVSLKIMKNQNQMGKSSSEEFEITYILDDIRNILANKAVCSNTLKDVNPYQARSLDGVKSADSDANFIYSTYASSGKFYGQNNLKIKSFNYIAGDQESSVEDGEAFISIVFEKSKSALGNNVIEKKIKIHVALTKEKTISSCFSLPGVGVGGKVAVAQDPDWFEFPGTENIYTQVESVSVGKVRRSRVKGVTVDGKLKLGESTAPCLEEKFGTLAIRGGVLKVCKKKGWVTLVDPRKSHYSTTFRLASKPNIENVVVTKTPFDFCTLKEMDLYGARCATKRLSGNFWELKVSYDRGKISKCSFLCLGKR